MPAQEEGRVTAAVQQNHCLFAALQTGCDSLEEATRENNLLAFGGIFLSHVDDFNVRQRTVFDSGREAQMAVFAGFGVVERLHRRRCGTQHNDYTRKLRAHDGGVACVVAWNFFLFVAGFVLFVDDDQAKILEWSKNSGARPNNDRSLARINAKPFVNALAFRQRAMEDGYPPRETLREAVRKLRSECNFRNEDQCRLARS